MRKLPRLYAIADAGFGDPVSLAAALFAGGARLIQLRNKQASSRTLLDQADAILKIAPAGAQVVINDRPDVARLAQAAGAHVGQWDLPPAAARRVVGADAIVGVSTHNMEQAIAADREPVDYIAVGPVFATIHKENPDPPLGLEAFGVICRRVTKPVVAIGGISLRSAPDVFAHGASAIAVIGDLLSAPDVSRRTREWLELV